MSLLLFVSQGHHNSSRAQQEDVGSSSQWEQSQDCTAIFPNVNTSPFAHRSSILVPVPTPQGCPEALQCQQGECEDDVLRVVRFPLTYTPVNNKELPHTTA